MRIGIILPNLLSWGPQRLIIDQIRYWPRDGDSFVVISLNRNADEDILRELKELGANVITHSYQGTNFSPREILKLRRTLRELDLDILHTHLHIANVPARLASIGLGYKVMTTYHNTDFGQTIESRWPNAMRFLSEFISARLKNDAFVAVSKTVLNAYRRICNRLTRVIYNGIDTDYYKRIKDGAQGIKRFEALEGRKTIITVGRLHEQKDPEMAIRTAAELKRRHFPFMLIIIGEGPLYPKLQRMVQEFGLGENVMFLGNQAREDVAKWYVRADLLLLTSLMEGFAIVAADALFMGTPIVCTDLAVLREVVGDDCGVFVGSRAPEIWADAIMDCLTDDEHKKAVRTLGPDRVCKFFSTTKNVEALAEFYDACQLQ